jgi:protein O-mannosyl-transferase
VAGLFALHPINVQSVAWVAERKNLLSMLFFLLALDAYRWYAQWVPQPSRHRREAGNIGRYLVVALLFAFGLMAKPQVITLPLVLLLWDYWPLARISPSANGAATSPAKSFAWLVVEKLPLFALSAGSAVVTLLTHRGGALRWLPLSIRIANAIESYTRYVKLAFWPSRLALFYPYPGTPLTAWDVLASLLFLVAVTWLVVEDRRRRYLPVGWFWFLITLLPMIGIVQVGTQAMADRYAYLPFIGLFLMIVWGVADWSSQWRVSAKWLTAAGLAVLIALSVFTHRQLEYWRDSVTLWTHTLEVTRGNYIAEVDLGAALVRRKEIARAMEHFRAASAIDPQDPLANMYIGRYAQMQNNLAEAIEAYKKVIAGTWDSNLKARAYRNMGYAYRALGDEAEAQKCFRAAANLGY